MRRPTRRAALSLCLGLLALWAAPAAAAPADPNDTARLLAGLPPSEGPPLIALTRDASWQRHARSLDRAWRQLETRQLSRIRAWSQRHLTRHRPLMLYPFSGPDFLYADAFFPRASTYVLAALEPVGPKPDLRRLPYATRSAALEQIRVSLQTLLAFSFFKTKNMKTDLRTGRLAGVLPVLYVFLARAGKTIRAVDLVSLNRQGEVEPRRGSAPRGSTPGVRITFSDEGRNTRTLYYFSTDLSNWGLKTSGFKTFVAQFGAADSLVKSASYLLHERNFTTARDFLLERSAAIVQDASGIPVRHFSRKRWTLHPFGRYLGPIEVFAQHHQPEMERLFARGSAQPIDFGIGYRWRPHQTNVLLAVKRSPLTAD